MHIKPKKSLGQNFLVDKNIRKKIMDACDIRSSDIILEIGSGRGELTESLIKKAGKVIALELDSRLLGPLESKFRDEANIKILHQDVLRFDIAKYFAKTKNRIKIIGNIPYYITSPIIAHLFRYKDKIDSVYLSVQKEFGRRIIAKPGSKDYGAFSCFVQFYADPKIIFIIKKGSFFPVPKVDSCFIKLGIRRKNTLGVKDTGLFFKIVRAAFNQRRKTLRNSLKGIIPQVKLEAFFTESGIPSGVRPEDLALEDFAALAKL